MSGVRLKPVDGGSDIVLLDGKTTIGRGPFMKVTDKRVSRLHAVLEVKTDKVTVSPIHVNPCFYKSAEKEKFITLPKEQTQVLKHGDQIALLPDQYIYELAIDEPGKEGIERLQSGSVEMKDDMNGKTMEEVSQDNTDTEKCDEEKISTEEKTEEGTLSGPTVKSFNGSSEEKDGDPENVELSEEEVEDEEVEEQVSVDPVIADPQEKARKLPGWMKSASSPKRQKISDLEDEDELDFPPKRGKKDDDEDFVVEDLDVEDEDDEEEGIISKKRKQPAQKKKTPPRGKKPKTLLGYISDEDEDIEDDTEDDSDEWTPIQRKKNAKSNTRNRTKAKQRIAKPVSQDRTIELNEYQTTKGDTSVSSSTSRIELSEEEEEEDDLAVEDEVLARKLTTRDQEDEGEEDKLPPCPYGLKCYRRNVVHFEEYSHPPGHLLGGVENDKPECPYGVKCLRSNPTHRKEYTHTQPPATARSGRPKRDSTSRKAGDSDDDVHALYEYDDSWLDESESSESYQDDPDDSDWEPEGSGRGSGGVGDEVDEDVSELVAEARSFLRKKRN